jgi:hypothetical protein
MKPERTIHKVNFDSLPRMPSWVTSARRENLEDVAFLSGAALVPLHLVQGREEVPHPLLRDRLALSAAEACVSFSGRPERAADLRDAVHLLRPGDLPGPAGAVYVMWRHAGRQPISMGVLAKALPQVAAESIATWLDVAKGGGPVGQATAVLETVLSAAPREEAVALILADAALARALSWKYVVPLLAAGLKPRDLRTSGEDLRRACHLAVARSAGEAVRMADDLARRAARLKSVAPKLRAKRAGDAVEMFLTRDAVSPSVTLTAPGVGMTDRAARRLCDRLVDLGVVRELTGRDSFRLYGL